MSVSSSLLLLALEPLPCGDWQQVVESILVKRDFHVLRTKGKLLAWKTISKLALYGYSDGWRITRLFLGTGRWALAFLAQRLYFAPDGHLDSRPEHQIIRGKRPGAPAVAFQIQSQWKLLESCLESFGGTNARPIALETLECNVGSSREVWVGEEKRTVPPASLDSVYKELGFHNIPEGFAVTLCPLDGVSPSVMADFSSRIRRACEQRRTSVCVRNGSVQEIEDNLRKIRASSRSIRPGRCVLFLLPQKSQPPSRDALCLLRKLEEMRVPFRRAYQNDPLDSSIPNQLSSLLMAAGGKPHQSFTRVGQRAVTTVGVDLAHRSIEGKSVVVLTLVDPAGSLVGAWTKIQPRDETVRSTTLVPLLKECVRKIKDIDEHAPLVVLRDGRFFEREECKIYQEILGTDLSLFEYRKGGNPQLVKVDGLGPTLSSLGVGVVPGLSGMNTLFLSTMRGRDDHTLPEVVKITWREEYNGLSVKAAELATLLTSSAAAPGLGPSPRNHPAAIYWADGIAGATDKDLRFRGIPVERLD